MKTLFRILILGIIGLLSIPFALILLVRTKMGSKPRPVRPVTDADIERAEAKLGFALPEEVKAFFLGRLGTVRRDCASAYMPAEAAREYRTATKEPYGPNGEDWPRNLFPIADLLPGFACYDLHSKLIVEWDPEEIAGGNESKAAWKRSFKPTGLSLKEWLAGEPAR